MKFQLNPLAHALSAALVLSLAACGGGGGDSVEVAATPGATTPTTGTTPPAAPTTPGAPAAPATSTAPAAPQMVTLTGSVMGNQAIRNALVCMDLNANSACDADEPASARTGADGAFSLSYDATKITAAQSAAASLIAPMVPGDVTGALTTVDAGDPVVGNTSKAFVLRQVPGKAGQINPLTTLVAKGMTDGMTEATARANLSQQLTVPGAKIDDYQSDAALTLASVEASARWKAQLAFGALKEGVGRVGDQSAAVTAGSGDLAQLRYTDASNFFFRTFDRASKAAGTPGVPSIDMRSGRTNGSVTTESSLYTFAYLAPGGWTRCNGPFESAFGTPSRSVYCGVSESVGFTVPTSIEGRTMAQVVNDMQADSATNVINNGIYVASLLSALGTAVFPAGSAIAARHTLTVVPGIQITSLTGDGRPQAEAQTLEQLIAARPADAVRMGSPTGTLTLGLGSGNFKNLRVAFTGIVSSTSGTVRFYECDLDRSQSVVSNCSATEIGTYAISSVNGSRVIRFAGHSPTVMNHTRVYAEVQNAPGVVSGNWVYQARENKPDFNSNFSVSKRLNATAWQAMKTQLGL